MAKQYPSYEELQKARENLSQLAIKHWIQNDLWHFNWWFNIILAIVPWFIWWKLVDRSKTFEILTYGLFSGIIATTLDTIGSDLVLWGYPDNMFSIIPPLFPTDLSVIPVSFMLLYQYFTTWKSFIWANIITAAVFSFVAEPILVKMNIYALHKWHYIFSFPIYVGISIWGRFLIQKIRSKQTSPT